jgi:hypothetical protein
MSRALMCGAAREDERRKFFATGRPHLLFAAASDSDRMGPHRSLKAHVAEKEQLGPAAAILELQPQKRSLSTSINRFAPSVSFRLN